MHIEHAIIRLACALFGLYLLAWVLAGVLVWLVK
jgi:hypothetical protein